MSCRDMLVDEIVNLYKEGIHGDIERLPEVYSVGGFGDTLTLSLNTKSGKKEFTIGPGYLSLLPDLLAVIHDDSLIGLYKSMIEEKLIKTMFTPEGKEKLQELF